LVLNQIGRRLTEELPAGTGRHRLLLMFDEFPALGRLDFFESALAFMAGYGLKSFLIAQSLNQIEKAYRSITRSSTTAMSGSASRPKADCAPRL
jgi:type IV secretion system protein VirD4